MDKQTAITLTREELRKKLSKFVFLVDSEIEDIVEELFKQKTGGKRNAEI